MSKTRVGGLGRGLGALIPTAPATPTDIAPAPGATAQPADLTVPPPSADGPLPVPGASFAEVDVDAIVPTRASPDRCSTRTR